jgi:manganese efflux pump family protein
MEIVSGLLVGIALAMDSFSVSITAGASMKNIKIYQSLLIAGYFGFFHWLVMVLGWYGGSFLNDSISTFDHWIALFLLLFIGGKMIFESFKQEDQKNFVFSHKIFLLLAVATSIDASAIGLSYSFLEKPILITSLLVGIIVFLLSYFGVYLGKYFAHIFKKRMEALGGIILIAIGIKIAIDHSVFLNI